MQVSLKDKVALVTGGSRGIGRACAVALARAGAKVAITYAGNEAAAQQAVALIEKEGGQARALKFDVADTAACAGAVDQVVQELGRLDVLVNNAGVAVDGLVMRVKDDDWDKQLDTNLKGPFALIRAASRPMMKQKGGSIINLTSVVGEMGNAGQVAYSSSKAGLIGLTKSVARELASRNIRVNAVSPGFIDTDMTAKVSAEARAKMMEGIPLQRLGSPEDVANAVVFLASDLAGYITGEVLKVNGGMYM
ncbi:MAG TPA: 3-oxoacyl-[acyl-carrier-protein] reductase [Myxococcales bacterium]|nr:3-oxoacyl-[acyl-carrier-protein] reductase [Myxococcales bacterium]